MQAPKKSRKEELEEELGALQILDKLEQRRRKSVRTVTAARNLFYDKQRTEVLKTLDPAVVKRLEKTDPDHQAYLQRLGEPMEVKDSEVEDLEVDTDEE